MLEVDNVEAEVAMGIRIEHEVPVMKIRVCIDELFLEVDFWMARVL